MAALVKICGVNSGAALDAVLDAGADFAGFVYFAKSPRHLDLEAMRVLRDHARSSGYTRTVVLTVDASDKTLRDIVDAVDPDFLQLHGHESLDRVAEVRQHFGRSVIKAVGVASREDVDKGAQFHDPGRLADIVLFDAKPDPRGPLPGGNGLVFDWHMLEGVRGRFPFALAGGLTPQNVAEALNRTGAAMADVSSGVESAPGLKDPDLIFRFLQAAKAARPG
jgi:phosphoribosylanthranilate isomerase